MRKLYKWIIFLIVIAVVFITDYREDKSTNPELVSTINSMNHEYCNIIVHKRFVQDKVELAVFLIELCKENAFDKIKFATDVRGYPSSVSLDVYLTEKDFKIGNQYMNVRYEMIEYRKDSNIRDNSENYQIYIDNELIGICEQS